jgi:GH25 family lysozyme M1 (1,4-beta-N-acetylmuramidase)
MAEATKAGGAEMGQGTRAGTSLAGDKTATTEALATEGTWMPGFGVQGLDVSKYQAGINWQTEWNMGARFAYIKATEGNYYTSTTFNDQYVGSRAVGMIRGAYHFANPASSSGAAQARMFVQSGGGWSADGYTLPPVLDFEGNPYAGQTIGGYYQGNSCYDMTPGQLTAWARDFGSTMQALTGRLPVMYTTTSWWNYCTGGAQGFGDWPLWIAKWPGSFSNSPGTLPTSWSNFSFWQYSESGPFAGGTGDSNVWNGSYSSLQQFAGMRLPTGSFDDLSVTRSGSEVYLRARGWSVDLANVSASIQTHVYVTDPSGVTTGYAWDANKPRADIDQAFGYGSLHGFDGSLRITGSGTYKVCAYAIGTFGNTLLDCKTVTASGVEAPIGSFDSLGEVRTTDKVTLRLKGWAADLSNPAVSSYADAYVTDPTGKTTGYRMNANLARPDVDAATRLGLAHGFDYQVATTVPGTYKACVYAIGQNSNALLSCRNLTVEASPLPIGSYDALTVTQAPNAANFQVGGWALDPTLPAKSIPVHVYVRSPDGTNPGYAFSANKPRPDVTAALQTVGDHGFQATVPLNSPGRYSVCAYAIGVAPVTAGNALLGCKAVEVAPTPATIGYLDAASIQVSSGQASVKASGWTLDPMFPAVSNPDHIYITSPDGTRKGYAFTANLKRPDVNSSLDTVGNHGFSASIPVTQRGQYLVCAYGVAVSKLSAGNSLLGCRSLTY